VPTIAHRGQPGRGARGAPHDRVIQLGLVNNMSDAALESTERQFLNILDAAAPDRFVDVRFFSLSRIPRGDLAKRRLIENNYGGLPELFASQLDGLIVTGAEPKSPDLRSELYWEELAELFDWIAREGPSTVFSCLAAHAAVLHFDGIERRRLPQKRFGLFDHTATGPHDLTEFLAPIFKIAHSRWNEVTAESLESYGYRILTQAPGAGVDLFVRRRRNLHLFFQGHPEYDLSTLGREYQRDVRRFLAREQAAYPQMPENYFDAAEVELLSRFRDRALIERSDALIGDFPAVAARRNSADKWQSPATSVFRTWLLQIAEDQAGRRLLPIEDAGRLPAWRHHS
jgi:homoserine O-succinyltransferase/O-acetyltransferase